MRNLIQEKLLELDSHIFYGLVPEGADIDEWNYFVFGQKSFRKSGTSGNDLNFYWYVTIVRENFIPDDDVIKVLNKITEIPGLRLADDECEFNYITKGNTNIVVEMVEIRFTKTKKGCFLNA